jgi:hypothetical protein
MTLEEIGRLEQVLGVKLPAAYRDGMMAYPFPEDSPAAELSLLNDIVLLLESNAEHRRRSEGGWPPHLVVIGTDGGEEAFALDTAMAPHPVLAYEMETARFKPYAPDFSSFVQMQRPELTASKPMSESWPKRIETSAGGNSGSALRGAGGAATKRTPPDQLRASASYQGVTVGTS